MKPLSTKRYLIATFFLFSAIFRVYLKMYSVAESITLIIFHVTSIVHTIIDN